MGSIMILLIRKVHAFLILSCAVLVVVDAYSVGIRPVVPASEKLTYRATATPTTTSIRMTDDYSYEPRTFVEKEREGSILMGQGRYEEALECFQKATKLPGSRTDMIRTKSNSGPSPVGGSYGGTDSQYVMSLDNCEIQSINYNIAAAHSRLGNTSESVAYLEKSFQYGFVVAVEEDRDFDPIRKNPEYIELINTFKPKSNPFEWIFKKKK